MDFITGWITNIILFVLLATVIDMLLPSSSFQKYAKMVIGLLLIAIIITPIFQLLSSDFEQILSMTMDQKDLEKNRLIENSTEFKKKEIQAQMDAYILEQMAVQLRTGVEEELMDEFKMQIKSVELQLLETNQPKIPEDLHSVSITLAPGDTQQIDAIETVSTVDIDTNRTLQEPTHQWNDIKGFLASKWGIEENQIQIEGERRDGKK
ncbi:stage III sporulation protein AF [Peribacillus alkalitolerans]|uniref:stage III sporulation protein AF n=1 Tax=Peribacillus alkalitolerans TaxID=1550385 RepID=UPI0013D14BE8|nr:stage III sporulation protein AF [Peribacillus alkalitolerans]